MVRTTVVVLNPIHNSSEIALSPASIWATVETVRLTGCTCPSSIELTILLLLGLIWVVAATTAEIHSKSGPPVLLFQLDANSEVIGNPRLGTFQVPFSAGLPLPPLFLQRSCSLKPETFSGRPYLMAPLARWRNHPGQVYAAHMTPDFFSLD